jgi:extracellular factor (EF) 3-hydroxypalmitic acid methyl ester biosynthesis protein
MNSWITLETPGIENIEDFMQQLERARQAQDAKSWQKFVMTNRAVRRWRYFLTCDPYTRWGLLKPRGYAGDATLMDFAYGHASVQTEIETAGTCGRAVYEITKGAQQSASARQRLEVIAQELTHLAHDRASLSAISFASGHGRELALLIPEVQGKLRFTAIDQDAGCLETLRHTHLALKVRLVNQNLLRGDFKALEPAHFTYSLGLFDYLDQAQAEAVLATMWRLTEPGGRLLIANLCDDAANLGYCEAIMDWWMIPRRRQDMASLGHFLTTLGGVGNMSVVEHGCFFYLSVERTA